MRKVLLPLLAIAATATPAMANEARVEARGGVFWTNGYTQDTYGVAAGYDFDLGQTLFAGAEVSGDKIADSGTKVSWGFTGRLGTKVGEKGKLYAASGYTTETCTGCNNDAVHLGAGYEQGFGKNLYAKVEYRHFFLDQNRQDGNAVVAGLGVKF